MIDLRRRAALLSCGLFLTVGCGRQPEEPEKAPPAPVKAALATSAEFGEWKPVLGTTQPLPQHVARVTAAVEGRVESLLDGGKDPKLAEGKPVKKGTVLARLDDRVARANFAKAEAAEEELNEHIHQAGLAVDLAKLELDAKLQLRTKAVAGADDLVSKIELDKAKNALQDAESRKRLALAKVKTSQAELKALKEQLDLYTLKAPIDGVLGMVRVAPGQTLTPGTLVTEILDLGEIDVLCFAPPALVTDLHEGQSARLAEEGEHKDEKDEKDAKKGKEPEAPGRVKFIAVQAQPETGNFAVKVWFPNPELRLRAGNVQRVEILTEKVKKRTVIPETALREDEQTPRVVVVTKLHDEENKETHKPEKIGEARLLEAEVGVRQGNKVEILGLKDPNIIDPKTKAKAEVPIQGTLFIIEGGYGLENDDRLVVTVVQPADKK
jgi:RND family efflux transporter MFP subunit